MKGQKFDVFVIGSGSAGQTVAETCARNGFKVAIADNRIFGGTCANRGCDPKKVLLAATEVWERSNNLKGKGITTTASLNWKQLQKFKRKFTSPVPAGTESKLKDLGIHLYHQNPEFINDNTLVVEGKTVQADKIVIATGRIPRLLDFEGSHHLKTSDDFLELKKIPKSIVFIGAGYIGMEFAHMAARAGSKVTIIERGERPLKNFDPNLVEHLKNVSQDLGITFIFNAEIKKIEQLRKNLNISYQSEGKEKSLKAKMVFNTAGRIPAMYELELEKGNVAYSEKGIIVNKYLQSTSNANVYACGDVTDHSLPLTPLSGLEGHMVSENIVHGNKKKIDTPVIPSSVFTLPHLASVGLSEEEAKKRYKNIKVNYKSVPKWFNAKRLQESAYAYKIIINERTETIVGAHLLSANAAETINLFAMAINNDLTSEQLRKMIFTYPSWSYDIKSMM
ncbi:dihydrolipoyl dehydrogenase family protein [Costertonia aggregata]|uniref:NAD(P)/FAD-dependent oxidoreductase n=1 Tax=Costertonia aggregata TaxID=343403 RepID=A0A7H9ANG9_9FLAO|nr:NAD(P)/FAD-dependent oxidoreductase [Costertonia aggregata]QLG44944.1 NAD(P)/FAD-dependent oxidoreductase [Costertonia aggregata]